MPRAPMLVRDATEGDAVALSVLWADLVAPAQESGEAPPDAASRAIARAREEPWGRIVVAEADGVVVGSAFLRSGLLSPLHEERVLHVSHLQVATGADRQQVTRALLEASVSWAEHRDVGMLLVATAANDREGNRLLARLGLPQAGVLRGAPVSVLRGRLPQSSSAAARNAARAGRSVGQVVAVRRSQRRARGSQGSQVLP